MIASPCFVFLGVFAMQTAIYFRVNSAPVLFHLMFCFSIRFRLLLSIFMLCEVQILKLPRVKLTELLIIV